MMCQFEECNPGEVCKAEDGKMCENNVCIKEAHCYPGKVYYDHPTGLLSCLLPILFGLPICLSVDPPPSPLPPSLSIVGQWLVVRLGLAVSHCIHLPSVYSSLVRLFMCCFFSLVTLDYTTCLYVLLCVCGSYGSSSARSQCWTTRCPTAVCVQSCCSCRKQHNVIL